MSTCICSLDALAPYEGRVVLKDDIQIALFYVPQHGVFALQNWDPIGHANVLARGIIGDQKGQLCVASPLYKQHFALLSGQCLEQPDTQLDTWRVEIKDGQVWLDL